MTDESTYFEQHGDALLRRMGISKTEFAEKMGVRKKRHRFSTFLSRRS